MGRVIHLPTSEEEVLSLKVGEVIYVTGLLVTARDAVHARFLVEGVPLPLNLRGLAILHAGPVMVKSGSKWVCRSIGPTTSMRMDYYEYEFIEKTGVKVVIGKGGMGSKTAEACKKFKAVYAVFPGGCGALGAEAVEEVVGVEWLDLGIPEALWILKVNELGPLVVTIDAYGNNLTELVKNSAKARASSIINQLKRST
ncbi:MAG: FumA C-terminus/TtdB family hydratase beta subunit [Sulfolobales archaeon]